MISTPTSWLCNLELQPSMALHFGDDNIITFFTDLKMIFDGYMLYRDRHYTIGILNYVLKEMTN